MTTPNFILLYVDSPARSAAFYADLLAREPVEVSATFVMFSWENGAMLGLWSRRTVTPAAGAVGGGSERGFPVASADAVDETFADWKARGIAILQRPTELDFGRTFVATDPDGHRLRAFAPGAA